MKKEGWESLLNEHINQAVTFEWGRNDCALWSADWVRKATDKDFGSEWKEKYTSEEGLQELLMEQGYATAADIADEKLTPIPVAFAQRGDIMLHPQGCLGICNGIMSHFLMAEGVTRLSTFECLKAWKVE